MPRQRGFTLIELMIVVAIVGILAAVGLFAYQDYVSRAKVAEGVSLATSAKTAVTDTYLSTGTWPTSNTSAGLAPAASIAGNNVSQITVTGTGVVTITYTNDSSIGNLTLELSPSAQAGSIFWTCSGGTLSDRYRPANCR